MTCEEPRALRASYRQAGAYGKVALALATWFGVGFLPRMPGTFAAATGLPLVWAMDRMGPLSASIFLVVLLVLALWSSGQAEKMAAQEDPRQVVIDEVVGLLVALFLVRLSWLNLFLGFALFRLFDIRKPFPLRRAEKAGGGVGIVLDDLLAGIYANLALRLIRWVLG